MPGFTQIPNEVFDDSLWTAEKFTKAQAYADLYRLAQFKPGLVIKRGHIIELEPGQIGWSQKELSKRWKRSLGWVRRLLKFLQKKGKIALQISNVSSTITLLDWIKNDNANSIANGVQIATKQYPNNTVNKENIENTVKRVNKKSSLLPLDEYQNLFPKKDIINSYDKLLKMKPNASHEDALKWFENEKREKPVQFKVVNSNYIAFCSKCGKQEFPNDDFQLRSGSSCCSVEYVNKRPSNNKNSQLINKKSNGLTDLKSLMNGIVHNE
tara:strand:- start:499 stop:1302 length:804 start_codon:yes stop_codon:yes gene_type:complete